MFLENLDLPADFDKLQMIHEALGEQKDIIHSIDSWYLDYLKYMQEYFSNEDPADPQLFPSRFTQFLYGASGSKHRLLMEWEEDMVCGQPAPRLSVSVSCKFLKASQSYHCFQMSMIQFTHNLMSGPKEQIPAMNRVKQIIKEANFTNRVFPMCIGYASWETDEVISEELYRNVLLAITCVFITTWLLLFNFIASIQVGLTPVAPKFLSDVAGPRLRHCHSHQCRGLYSLLGTDH